MANNLQVAAALSATEQYIQDDVGNSSIVAIGTDGKVGIGTTNPQVTLQIEGSVRGNQYGSLEIDTGNGTAAFGPRNSGWCHVYTDRAKFYIQKEIQVATGNIGSYDSDLSLGTAGTTRITASNTNGNVGVGTTTPKTRLHGTDSTIVGAASSAAADADMGNSQVNFWVDESNNKLKFKVKYSSGTVKTGEVALS